MARTSEEAMKHYSLTIRFDFEAPDDPAARAELVKMREHYRHAPDARFKLQEIYSDRSPRRVTAFDDERPLVKRTVLHRPLRAFGDDDGK